MAPLPTLASSTDYADLIGAAPAGVNLDKLLGAASSAVRRFCGWHVAPAVDATLTVDGSGGRDLMLPTLALNSVASVTEGGVVVDPMWYEWTASGWLRKPAGRWTGRLRGVVAEVNHGFDGAADLVELVCRVAARSAVQPAGIVREQALTQSVQYATAGGVALMADEKADLALYRLPGRP